MNPLTFFPPNNLEKEKKCYCRFYRIHMFSDFIHACAEFSFRMWKMSFQSIIDNDHINPFKENVFIIDNDHISPFEKKKKEPAIIYVSDKN